jgi:hypothetical protein
VRLLMRTASKSPFATRDHTDRELMPSMSAVSCTPTHNGSTDFSVARACAFVLFIA